MCELYNDVHMIIKRSPVDIQMFEVATKGFFINAPENISSKYPNINSFHNYNDLEKEILLNSVFVE